ncbi:phospholipase-like protein [Tanacetum coccineum]
MTDSIQLYDVKVVVRSALKLLPEIKCLLSSNPNRLNLFRRTVFGPWLDLPSHYNDNHLMHYVLQHQVHVSEITSKCPPIIFRIGDHMLHFGRKEFSLLTGFRLGVVSLKHENLSCFCTRVFPDLVTEKDIRRLKSCHLLALVRDKKGWAGLHDIDAVRVCLLIVAELVFMGKEDRNCIPRHLVTLVEDFDAWNDYPWGEYMWAKFYERTVNIVYEHRQHHLDEKKKNPNYNATYNLYGFAWAFKVRSRGSDCDIPVVFSLILLCFGISSAAFSFPAAGQEEECLLQLMWGLGIILQREGFNTMVMNFAIIFRVYKSYQKMNHGKFIHKTNEALAASQALAMEAGHA